MTNKTRPVCIFSLFALAALLLFPPGTCSADERLHSLFDGLLKKYVRGGEVSYAGFKEDEATFDAYLDILARTDPDTLDRNGKFAFWINAYNAFTIKLILGRYPGIESIRDIPRGDRWRWKGWVVNGKKLSLDTIEHKILRPMGDARIHFAIVCASKSCPDLVPDAYSADSLDAQLDAAARRFLADETKGLRVADEKGRFGGVNHTAYISEIFHWFEDDFKKSAGSRIDFIIPRAPEDAKRFLKKNRYDLKVKKLDYDWSLNGK